MGERATQGAWKYGMKILTLPLSKETGAGSPWSGVSTTSECGWTGSLQLSTAAGAASAALMAEVREVEQDRMAPPPGGRGARGGGQDGRVEQRASDWMAAATPLHGIPDPYSSP